MNVRRAMVLVRADPADGAVLPSAPSAVRLAFNEPVVPLGGGLRVFAVGGALAVGAALATRRRGRGASGLSG